MTVERVEMAMLIFNDDILDDIEKACNFRLSVLLSAKRKVNEVRLRRVHNGDSFFRAVK